MSAKSVSRRKSKDEENDPIVASFLQFMEKQMIQHPEDIVAADAAQLRRIGKLVKSIEAALDELETVVTQLSLDDPKG